MLVGGWWSAWIQWAEGLFLCCISQWLWLYMYTWWAYASGPSTPAQNAVGRKIALEVNTRNQAPEIWMLTCTNELTRADMVSDYLRNYTSTFRHSCIPSCMPFCVGPAINYTINNQILPLISRRPLCLAYSNIPSLWTLTPYSSALHAGK